MQTSLTRRGAAPICCARLTSADDEEAAEPMNAISPSLLAQGGQTHYRTVFLSDTHLGTRGCRSDFLAHFLGSFTTEHLFLVGDIVDGWRLRKSWYWDEMHDEVVRLLLRHAADGARVLYIPGNHDEMFRPWLSLGLELGGVRFADEAVHETQDGRRLLIIHGDQFDSVVRYAKTLALLGDWAYGTALHLNRYFNAARRLLGYPYWSLSQWAKRQVKGGGQGGGPVRGTR